MKNNVYIENPESILPLLQKWQKRKQENFLAITLNGAHEVIKIHHITKGLVNKVIIHPRECFYPVIKDLAVAVILVHNHPSGCIKTSPADDEITKQMWIAAQILGINLLDHIIITPNSNYFSYRKEGMLPKNKKINVFKRFVKSLEKDYKNK